MQLRNTLLACSIAMLSLTACQGAGQGPGSGSRASGDPDGVVANLRDAYAATPCDSRYQSCQSCTGRPMRSKVMIRRQSENLLFQHPDHVDGRMVAALLAYEAGDRAEAGRHLDHVLRIDPATPDAALLRARIALEEGNPHLARRLLEAQVELRPDHAGLRETYASALFLTGDLDKARTALDDAERLGAAPGRIAYNRGLVAEADGDSVLAARHYTQALEHVPHWHMPTRRLRGLRALLPAEQEARAPATAIAVETSDGFPPPARRPQDVCAESAPMSLPAGPVQVAEAQPSRRR